MREYCRSCSLPKKVCLCPFLPETPFHSDTTVLIVQHPLESKRSARSDFIAKRIIQICRTRKFPDFPADSVLLFPSADAVDLETHLETSAVPACLVVPDRPWRFTREMVNKLETENRSIKAVKLSLAAEYRGAFVVRKPPQPGWVSTGEAVALALDQIDQKAGRAKHFIFAPAMRKALTGYSAQQLSFAKGKEIHRPEKNGYVSGLYQDI